MESSERVVSSACKQNYIIVSQQINILVRGSNEFLEYFVVIQTSNELDLSWIPLERRDYADVDVADIFRQPFWVSKFS